MRYFLFAHMIQVLPAMLEVPLDYTDLKVLSKALNARFTVPWHPLMTQDNEIRGFAVFFPA